MVVENYLESQKPVENHRFTLCERFCERGGVWVQPDADGPLTARKRVISL